MAQALAALEGADPAAQPDRPTQAHDLIRSPQEYGDLFALAAVRPTTTATPTPIIPTPTESTAEGGLVA